MEYPSSCGFLSNMKHLTGNEPTGSVMDCAGREEQGIEYFTWPSDNGLCQYDQGSDFSDLSANEFSDDQNGWWIHNGSQPVWVSGDPQLSPPYPHTNVSQMAGEDFWPPSTQLNYSSDGYSSACSSPDLHVPEIRGTSRRQTPLMWQFLLRLLFESFQQLNDSSTALLVWLDRESGVFLIRRPRYLAQLWGQVKNKPNMTYPNMARGMRDCRTRGFLEKMTEEERRRHPRRLVFKFSKKALEWMG